MSTCKRRIALPGLLAGVMLMLWSSLSLAESPDDILVFVNKQNRQGQLSRGEVKRIFLRQKTSWGSGGRIICINAKESSALRREFRQRTLGMRADEEKRYWEAQKIKGGLSEPPTFANTVKAVFKIKGGISYGFRKDVKASLVKVVFTAPAAQP